MGKNSIGPLQNHTNQAKTLRRQIGNKVRLINNVATNERQSTNRGSLEVTSAPNRPKALTNGTTTAK